MITNNNKKYFNCKINKFYTFFSFSFNLSHLTLNKLLCNSFCSIFSFFTSFLLSASMSFFTNLFLVSLLKSSFAEEQKTSITVNPDGSINTEEIPVFRTVKGPPPQQYWVTFINQANEPIELYYDDGRNGILQGTMPSKGSTLQIGTYGIYFCTFICSYISLTFHII